jgi:hypothetical protein
MGRASSLNEEKLIAYGMFVGKPEGKRPLGRPIWSVDNFKKDL